ncbi:Hypothetical predicted protein [Marmota monax]|uniref:Uncharacterized protein n=1 Tax=Marmota monax TaxID=9995 RepID=A0A5E4ACG4_MARMO|nr:Hypothetical predicted protein [Marmota monax]
MHTRDQGARKPTLPTNVALNPLGWASGPARSWEVPAPCPRNRLLASLPSPLVLPGPAETRSSSLSFLSTDDPLRHLPAPPLAPGAFSWAHPQRPPPRLAEESVALPLHWLSVPRSCPSVKPSHSARWALPLYL